MIPEELANVSYSLSAMGAKFDELNHKLQSKLTSKISQRIKFMNKDSVAKTAYS